MSVASLSSPLRWANFDQGLQDPARVGYSLPCVVDAILPVALGGAAQVNEPGRSPAEKNSSKRGLEWRGRLSVFGYGFRRMIIAKLAMVLGFARRTSQMPELPEVEVCRRGNRAGVGRAADCRERKSVLQAARADSALVEKCFAGGGNSCRASARKILSHRLPGGRVVKGA